MPPDSFIPRPKQAEVLAYTGGKMGVSAVPGSGKTETLSRLAAQLIAGGDLAGHQEVLVVTLVNSAVDNFYKRVSNLVKTRGLLPHAGYRVRTLHGLSHDIVRERPALVGLSDKFEIVDERSADEILGEAAAAWLRSNPYALERFLDPALEASKLDWVRRDPLLDQVKEVALAFTRLAKDRQLTPETLRGQLDTLVNPLPLAEMGWAIYTDYQRALAYRGAVDFDDLIRLALLAVQSDDRLLTRLRDRWPYILEDEAQDSSRLQEQILRLLTGPDGNWVRV
ncbi:MAG: UvrD-helicase domain-containing protein, partial [Anaerolineae bacterium]|nr:UvrD-helicase domain-containing protein [Anaerolineae bacterium]